MPPLPHPGTLRILRPARGVWAFYDGRVDGHRFAQAPNWVDDGALSLGIASYAIVEGDQALIYDTHVSVDHGRFIRAALEADGVRRFTVVLSHWHLDHVAGTQAFADCPVMANSLTADHLARRRDAIEAGTLEGQPPIRPLVLPTETFERDTTLSLGRRTIRLIQADIHSDDATVLWLGDERLLLAGDTMEDSVTYVGEPTGFERHLADLARLKRLGPLRILPNHGDPHRIAAGGYDARLIDATAGYIAKLRKAVTDPDLAALPLLAFIADDIAAGSVGYFAPYEAVHRNNIAVTTLAASGRDDAT